ncbi:hypothetical protein [uncultured Parabacteroides sp.]|uniref:hypothetical protein n=1 Tax=uncultured Parabacteroides sp. TaxID=512312 RepID=UPI002729A249|nr:hypothetical protein [uncultured Parabacteroides sp.]
MPTNRRRSSSLWIWKQGPSGRSTSSNPVKRYKLPDFSSFCAIDPKTNTPVMTAYYHDDPFVVYQLDE